MTREEALAEAWASIDGKLELFKRGRDDREFDEDDGTYSGMVCEAAELIRRLEARGYTVTPNLCEDEGCDHHGTPHVCITRVETERARRDGMEDAAEIADALGAHDIAFEIRGEADASTETKEGCLCIRCCRERPKDLDDPLGTRTIRFACEVCGNKRCPHHSDHRLTCTNSNEPGQPGSIYQ